MSLRIIKAGLFDSIQDGGRWGHQHLGINPGGWMDRYSAQLANALLGKRLSAVLLELTFPAATILFESATIICLTGAHFSPTINGWPIPMNQPTYLPPNSLLEFTHQQNGRWCYLSLIHDLQTKNWLGSYSTNIRISAGGHKGRTLHKEDRLLYTEELQLNVPYPNEIKKLNWQESQAMEWGEQPFSFIKGAEWLWLAQEGREVFEKTVFAISRQSDRMGYRLSGSPIPVNTQVQLVSSAVCAGTVQLLPNGQLIVLMADHQTTGGYPRIGYITAADLSHLAQCQPGHLLKFREVNLAEAEQKQSNLQKYLQGLKNACTFKMQNIVHGAL
ncbi:MAG: biotin-dependent carboxyltransferase family protein [Flaviaesturariibacter sp.]|nr:biotin-dependent carboxyltransferase family protein [Flaviaesturariibacter sp.]